MSPFWVQEPHSFGGKKQVFLGLPCHPKSSFYKVVVLFGLVWAAPLYHVWLPRGPLCRGRGECRPEELFQPEFFKLLPHWAGSEVAQGV